MTRTSRNWRTRPGGFDTLHLHRYSLPCSHPLGFPDLLPQDFVIQDLDDHELLPYHTTERDPARLENAVCHFFIDDYRFESVWTRPVTGLHRVKRFAAALTPDFSLYANWPTVAQQWNHYRSQWIGRYWQVHGIQVIPSANWSTEDSYYWAFAGNPTGQVLALAVPDLRDPVTHRLFYAGFRALVQQLQPTALLVYGQLPVRLIRKAEPARILSFPTHWEGRR
ncbi:MAG: DUF4417 domain-containing protein [Candidatus Competibacteraceae bacterium]